MPSTGDFMRTAALSAFTAALLSTAAFAATPDEILAANRAATGGDAWNRPAMAVEMEYAGNGLTGKGYGTTDLRTGIFEQHYAIGPQTGANGYDGSHVWNKDNAGIVTLQEAADAVPLAINNAYRNANLWWTADHGGAAITADGSKTDNGATYDVLTIVPKGGQSFDAWFDAETHLLYRTDELQGGVMTRTVTTDYRDYGGTQQPQHITVNQGDPKYDQHFTLTKVTFLPKSDPAAYAPPKSAAADFSIAGGAHAVTFPFQLVNNHIHADVTINGRGPYNFIFDTGGVNIITPQLAHELGIETEGAAQAHGAGDATMEMALAHVDEINVGGAIIKNQLFVSIDLGGSILPTAWRCPAWSVTRPSAASSPRSTTAPTPSRSPTPNSSTPRTPARRCTSPSTATPRSSTAPMRACPASSRSTPARARR